MRWWSRRMAQQSAVASTMTVNAIFLPCRMEWLTALCLDSRWRPTLSALRFWRSMTMRSMWSWRISVGKNDCGGGGLVTRRPLQSSCSSHSTWSCRFSRCISFYPAAICYIIVVVNSRGWLWMAWSNGQDKEGDLRHEGHGKRWRLTKPWKPKSHRAVSWVGKMTGFPNQI